MATLKIFEIRDRGTCISAAATSLTKDNTPQEAALVRWSGFYGSDPLLSHVLVINLYNLNAYVDHRDTTGVETGRTFREAMKYIQENFDTLNSGDVVDVEYILGEVTQPKVSCMNVNK